MIYLCSWHPQYHGSHLIYRSSVDGEWRDLTPLVVTLIEKAQVTISHGICENCSVRVHEELDFERRREETGNNEGLETEPDQRGIDSS